MESKRSTALEIAGEIARLAREFETSQSQDSEATIENVVEAYPQFRESLLSNLIQNDIRRRAKDGDLPAVEEYLTRFPRDHSTVTTAFEAYRRASVVKEDDGMPKKLGRYEIQRQLGRGGFGVVYLANDSALGRRVAIKVPRLDRFTSSEQVSNLVHEARNAAILKHPSLVAVYDVQCETQDGRSVPFIVQEYIEGVDLGEWVEANKPSFEALANIFVDIAEALAYAHQQCLTHCDLKLSNIIMDVSGRPHIADFGLAIRDSNKSARQGFAGGTPSMMSPEQVRDAGDRLDGRADVWAVGVMMYELFADKKPFRGETIEELFDQIETMDPSPPRQFNRRVPRELERICLKCLSKERTHRYNTADDLRDDLKAWLAESAVECLHQIGTDSNDQHAVDFDPKAIKQSSSNRLAGDVNDLDGKLDGKPALASLNAKLGGCSLSIVVMASVILGVLKLGVFLPTTKSRVNDVHPPLVNNRETITNERVVDDAGESVNFDEVKSGLAELLVEGGDSLSYASIPFYAAGPVRATKLRFESIQQDGKKLLSYSVNNKDDIESGAYRILTEVRQQPNVIRMIAEFSDRRFWSAFMVSSADSKRELRIEPIARLGAQGELAEAATRGETQFALTEKGRYLLVLLSSEAEILEPHAILVEQQALLEKLLDRFDKPWSFVGGNVEIIGQPSTAEKQPESLKTDTFSLQSRLATQSISIDMIAFSR